ncbi:MAG: ribokinase [Planctomycetota bacterium]
MIVVIGSLNMDLVIAAPRFPRAGETVAGSGLRTIPGGKGANQAVASARLGAAVRMVGCLGADAFGRELRRALADDHVDVDGIVAVAGMPTGVALIVVEPSGENRIVLAPGANAAMTPAMAEQAAARLTAEEVLLLQLEVSTAAVVAAARAAARRGAAVLLNAAPAQELERDALRAMDVVLVNETEAGSLTGHAPVSSVDAQDAARQILALGPRLVIVTSARAVPRVAPGESVVVPAPAVDVVDTTAAEMICRRVRARVDPTRRAGVRAAVRGGGRLARLHALRRTDLAAHHGAAGSRRPVHLARLNAAPCSPRQRCASMGPVMPRSILTGARS